MVRSAKMEVFEQGGEERLQVFGAPALQFASSATPPEWGGEIKFNLILGLAVEI